MRKPLDNILISSVISLVIGIGILTPTARAQLAQEDQQIQELVHLTGVDALITNVIADTFKRLEFSFPQVPPEQFQQFQAGVNTEDAVTHVLLPIYRKYFAPAEIEELLKFYKSPTGQKFLAVHSQMMSEAIPAAKQWGEALAREFIKQLDQKTN